jgi:hypothetical protein
MDCGEFPLELLRPHVYQARLRVDAGRPSGLGRAGRRPALRAASYRSVISDLTGAAWLGPAQVTMTAPST